MQFVVIEISTFVDVDRGSLRTATRVHGPFSSSKLARHWMAYQGTDNLLTVLPIHRVEIKETGE